MRTSMKKTLLASVAGAALAMGWAISPANAFDKAYWTFDLNIDPCVRIAVDLDPASLTTVEVDQSQIGDVTAISVVKDITVTQPGTHTFWCFTWNSGPALDAVSQLGSIVSAATAVANNASISTQTDGLFVDANQVASGGWLTTGDVTAKSIVKDITNLTVDSSATAVANNLNISAQVPGNLSNVAVVANVDQDSFMNVTAKSIVKDVNLSNYANLGGSFRPVVSSTATAVGNNLSVSVGVLKP